MEYKPAFISRLFFVSIIPCLRDAVTVKYRGQVWIQEESIQDGYTADNLIKTTAANSILECLIYCMAYPDCITVGFSQALTSCDMYSMDLSDQQSMLSSQIPTVFYKATCGTSGYSYTYVRYLDLCMKPHFEVHSFHAARDICKNEGGDLMPVKNQSVRRYLQALLSENAGEMFWIGAWQNSDDISEWYWVDGTEMSYQFWSNGEPSYHEEHCGFVLDLGDNLRLFNGQCHSPYSYICAV